LGALRIHGELQMLALIFRSERFAVDEESTEESRAGETMGCISQQSS